ncbi:MAG: hypothetical protein ABJN42_24850 [Roseibium sp.]|uniref:hypothetical protein n=1 Tax=Roseibium sp. TaxID=1936156 RepID=UPI003297836F
MISKTCKANTHKIWIAGDYDDAVRACRDFTMCGACVAVQKADYVYTMGMEAGVCVTLINYPRVPLEDDVLKSFAIQIGHHLCRALHQGSFTVEGPEEMTWFSRRESDMVEGEDADGTV